MAVTAAFGAVVAGSLLLLGTLLGVLMVEGSQVLVDDLGLSVEHGALPTPLARQLGAGRLLWKQVSRLERSGPLLCVCGAGEAGTTLRRIPPSASCWWTNWSVWCSSSWNAAPT
ncbi:MAG: hypothetical protein IPI84_01490 [Holophagaceae bacterium]|nr:hypothetical protein [Holophagaceae bacterium]